jgi:hypothetical protein
MRYACYSIRSSHSTWYLRLDSSMLGSRSYSVDEMFDLGIRSEGPCASLAGSLLLRFSSLIFYLLYSLSFYFSLALCGFSYPLCY